MDLIDQRWLLDVFNDIIRGINCGQIYGSESIRKGNPFSEPWLQGNNSIKHSLLLESNELRARINLGFKLSKKYRVEDEDLKAQLVQTKQRLDGVGYCLNE